MTNNIRFKGISAGRIYSFGRRKGGRVERLAHQMMREGGLHSSVGTYCNQAVLTRSLGERGKCRLFYSPSNNGGEKKAADYVALLAVIALCLRSRGGEDWP